MWDFKLIKQAKEKNNTKNPASHTDEKDTDIELSNWDRIKLGLGAAAGVLGGAAAGSAAGYGIGNAVGGRSNTELGTTIGTLAGVAGGSWLGHYLTLKHITNNRNVISD